MLRNFVSKISGKICLPSLVAEKQKKPTKKCEVAELSSEKFLCLCITVLHLQRGSEMMLFSISFSVHKKYSQLFRVVPENYSVNWSFSERPFATNSLIQRKRTAQEDRANDRKTRSVGCDMSHRKRKLAPLRPIGALARCCCASYPQ